jgi:hypothetical protein
MGIWFMGYVKQSNINCVLLNSGLFAILQY